MSDELDEKTMRAFLDDLEGANEPEDVITLDFPDADNIAALIALLARRLRNGAKGVLHCILVGRPFSARVAPAYLDAETKLMTFYGLPTAGGGDGERFAVDGKTFGAEHVKEGFGEPRDPEHERMLYEINVARFKAVVRSCGFDLSSVVFYYGGIAERAGLSYKAHCAEWKFLKDAGSSVHDCSTLAGEVELGTADELGEFNAATFAKTPLEREAYFKQCWAAVPEDLRSSVPLVPFHPFAGAAVAAAFAAETESSPKKARSEGSVPLDVQALTHLALQGARFRLYAGAPLTGFEALPDAVKGRVVLVLAMFGALDDGSKNLLGGNFNGVVAFEAARKFALGGMFPNARIVFFPTNLFKTKEQVCTLDAAAVFAVNESSLPLKWLAAHVFQWTGLKRMQPQPLFDVAVLFKLTAVARFYKVFPAAVVLGPNKYAAGTPFEECGLQVVPVSPKTWLTGDSPFPVGLYSADAFGMDGVEGGNFEPGATDLLSFFLRSCF
jgi:hypothetical protein